MSQTITIYWDEQEVGNEGWVYRIAHSSSGAIDGQAAEAINRILADVEAEDGDHDAIREAIEHHEGDAVKIIPAGGLGAVRLGDLLDRED